MEGMPPYQYAIDTSAIIDLKNQYPRSVFETLWGNFEEMCLDKRIISIREVKRELHRGLDELLNWSNEFDEMFLEPEEKEVEFISKIYDHYSEAEKQKHLTSLWADPLIIGCAAHYGITLIHQEKGGQFKIPNVSKAFGVDCMTLPIFFENEGWRF
jgi:hypothetical protein